MPQPHPDPARTPPPPAARSATLLVAAVIVHDTAHDRVLLIQRGPNAKYAAGMWELPVGKHEPGERITDTAVRELHEETGLVVQPESLRVAHLVHGLHGVDAPDGFLTVVFATHDWTGTPENREPTKHAALRWADPAALPTPFVPTSAEALHHYLAGGPEVAITGW